MSAVPIIKALDPAQEPAAGMIAGAVANGTATAATLTADAMPGLVAEVSQLEVLQAEPAGLARGVEHSCLVVTSPLAAAGQPAAVSQPATAGARTCSERMRRGAGCSCTARGLVRHALGGSTRGPRATQAAAGGIKWGSQGGARGQVERTGRQRHDSCNSVQTGHGARACCAAPRTGVQCGGAGMERARVERARANMNLRRKQVREPCTPAPSQAPVTHVGAVGPTARLHS